MGITIMKAINKSILATILFFLISCGASYSSNESSLNSLSEDSQNSSSASISQNSSNNSSFSSENNETSSASSSTPLPTFIPTARYVPNQVNDENGFRYIYSALINETEEYHYFYLGVMDNTPISFSDAKKYTLDGQQFRITYGTATYQSLITTTSIAKEHISPTFNSSVSIDLGVPSFVLSGKASYGSTWSSEPNITISNTHAETYATTLTVEQEIRYTFFEQYGYRKGYSYREVLLQKVDVYGVLIFNRTTESYTYQLENYIKSSNNRTYVTEESDSEGSFTSSTSNVSMNFNIGAAIQFVEDSNHQVTEELISEELRFIRDLGFDAGFGTATNPLLLGGKIKPVFEQFLLLNNYDQIKTSLESRIGQLNRLHFKLGSDINLAFYSPPSNLFKPIITGDFKGVFDANFFKIKNWQVGLSWNNLDSNKFGLFETISGEVNNLTIDNFDFNFLSSQLEQGENLFFGFLAGSISPTAQINYVKISNSKLKIFRAKSYYGSIIGFSEGKIANSLVENLTLEGNGNAGGMVGQLGGTGIIESSIVKNSNITHKSINGYENSTGGFIGYSEGTLRTSFLSNNQFYNFHQGTYFKDILNWFAYYSPKSGWLVGHQEGGQIIGVGSQIDPLSTKTLLEGTAGDYYFANSNWGLAGKVSGNTIIKTGEL